MKIIFYFIFSTLLFSLGAFADCPDLGGVYSYMAGNNEITLSIKTKVTQGKTIYNFERSNVGGKPWIWESTADGKSYEKKMSEDYTNVKEIAVCKQGKLFRSLTGDWINGDEFVPFDVESEMSNPSKEVLLWKSDFSGYGIRHQLTEERYNRKSF